jgi:hypothetical protein
LVRIELLSPEREEEYDAFLKECPAALLYYSRKYRNVLHRVLHDSSAFYLVAYEADRLTAVLPTFVKFNSRFGNVLNSLPFFGSHGGILTAPKTRNPLPLKRELLGALGDLCVTNAVVSSTLITNPLEPAMELYENDLRWPLRDTRMGQITPLPGRCPGDAELDERLFQQFHAKTRNSIRKAQRSGIEVMHDGSLESLHALASLHLTNMEALGGIPKPWDFFAAVHETFVYDEDYRLYLARKDGRVIGALLMLFFNKTAEYFVPATAPDYRIYQPMSLLVFEAMREAVKRGNTFWNWGGTWKTQGGVYHFKKRWGTQDMPYTYHIDIRADNVLAGSREELLREYPYFYVAPFEKLRGSFA